MTTKILNGVYFAAYNLAEPITTLSITAAGYLGGGLLAAGTGTYTIVNAGGIRGASYGVSLAGSGIVTNTGTIWSTSSTTGRGVDLKSGGTLVNGGVSARDATIGGYVGVQISGFGGAVDNYGTITASFIGADISGTLVNFGAITARGSTKYSGFGVILENGAGVANLGTIDGGTANGGVFLNSGRVSNGSSSDTSALISGRSGVVVGPGVATIVNYGTILGQSATITSGAIELDVGGAVVNGSVADTVARIQGGSGVTAVNVAATVTNFGTISDLATGAGSGVVLQAGGRIVNGANSDVTALVEGHRYCVNIAGAAGTVSNFGTIRGGVLSGGGVYLQAGGTIINGSSVDGQALIAGYKGVLTVGASAKLINDGTISGSTVNGGVGAEMVGGGMLTNGAASLTAALIQGFLGVELFAGAVATNFGTIRGTGANGDGAAVTGAGARLTNGSATAHSALVVGFNGALVGAAATLTSFATVQAMGGYAVILNDPTARLNAEAGSVFIGAVNAAGGTVDVVSGSATVGALLSNGLVEGLGTLTLAGGLTDFSAGAKLNVARIAETGAASLVEISAVLADSKVFTQAAGTLTVDATDRITFAAAGNSFVGTLTGAGVVSVTAGSDTFAGATLSASTMIISGATVTLSGAITLTTSLTAASSHLIVAAGGATLSGGGTLAFSNASTNKITGASAGATLTNADKITGAGLLGAGSMTLVNQAAGIIDGNLSTALIIDTGAATIVNAGLIESAGTGGVTIMSAVANSGSLTVTKGVLTLAGTVTGAGTVRIGGGTADVATSSFNQAVVFTGTTGVLELANSQGYAGSISGFSKTGTTSLDLVDIGFTSGTTKAAYSGTATAGVLTVTDGTHTAMIHLTGDYTASIFTTSSDGHGGTSVVDPTAPRARTLPLVAAMAGFASSPGSASDFSSADPPRRPILAHA